MLYTLGYLSARRWHKQLTGMFLLLMPAFASADKDGEILLVSPKFQATESGMVSVQVLKHTVPGKARKEMEKAERARLANRNEEAITSYKQVISIDPEYVAAHNNLAILYLNGSNTQLGLAELEEAITVDPHNPTLFTNLAIGYVLDCKLEVAERTARLAVDLDRSSALARMLLGLVLIAEHKFTDEALHSFETVMNHQPLAHLLAGRVLIGQGQVEKGKSEVQTYLASGDQDNRELANKWLDVLERNQWEFTSGSAR